MTSAWLLTSAGLGLDVELLAERLGKFLADDAGDQVGWTARSKRNEQAYRFVRVAARALCVAGIAAYKDHCANDQPDQCTHLSPPFISISREPSTVTDPAIASSRW